MGRKVGRTTETGIPMERMHPGCMRGIVQALQHQPWNHVRKKMLPQRRRCRGSEKPGNDIDGELQEQSYTKMESSSIEEQTTPSVNAKGSVRSRIKAFITEEMSKRRVRHRRCKSYPARVQLTRTDSFHHLQHLNFDHLNEASIDSSSNNFFERQGNGLSTKRELFLKALLQKTNSTRGKYNETGYAKSISFPPTGLADKRRRKFASMEDRGILLSPQMIKPDLYHSKMEKDEENKTPRKRFKSLKERIKHAMRESKKERRRITMDAVLHKIPYGRKLSDEKCEKVQDFRKEKGKSKCFSFKPQPRSYFDDSLDRYRRLYFSCFNPEARNHIVERMKLRGDEDIPLSSEDQTRTMARIFSLPDLRLYYLLQSEELSGSITKSSNYSYLMKEVDKTGSGINETEPIELSVSSENEILFDTLVKCGHENRSAKLGDSASVLENDVGSISFVDFKVESLEGLGVDDLGSWTIQDENLNQIERSSVSLPTSYSVLSEEADPETKPLCICFDEDCFDEERALLDSLSATENKPNIEKTETSLDQVLRVAVTSEDILKFNFVKYVLELSGFSKNEILGEWHSPEQPLDPLMFEEFYEEDQQGKNLENLLMFDLVNQVLLEIYEKSFTYCPVRLCSISYTRPLPKGHHVLEEVWAKMSWHFSWRPEADQLLDDAISGDLNKSDEWMNLHFEAECVGLELEDMIFEDLLEELVST